LFHRIDPFTQQPFTGGLNVNTGFKTILKVLNRYNLVTVLDLSKYSSALLKDAVGWREDRMMHFHKKNELKEQAFHETALNGCEPEKPALQIWKDRYPLRGCVDKAVWDWWNEAAYLGERCFVYCIV
jgi:hypothetical protein